MLSSTLSGVSAVKTSDDIGVSFYKNLGFEVLDRPPSGRLAELWRDSDISFRIETPCFTRNRTDALNFSTAKIMVIHTN
jgi:hypothetical protein